MGLNRDCDIDAAQRKTVLALLERHLPNTAAWAYGSRAKWTARPQSDLDMVVFASPEQNGQVSHLREAFEESNLPFRVDLFVWDAVPEKFRKQIEAEHVVLVAGRKQGLEHGWRKVILGDVIELKRGYDLPQRKRMPGAVPIVSSSGITDHHSEGKVQGPGVVTGRYGTLGRVFFIPDNFWPLNTTLYVRDFKGNDPRFIRYFLQELNFFAYSDKAAVPGLNRNHLHQAVVRIPEDVNEQRAIARILGALDDKIELNRRMNETLEAMARALFRSWFVDFDPVRAKMAGRDPNLPKPLADLFPDRLDNATGLPVGWQAKPLDGIAEFINGLALQKYPASSHQESLPVIKIAELRNGISSKSNRASFEIPEKYIIKNGDFLFSWSGSLMAKFWAEGKGALNQHLFKVTSEHYPPWFYANWVYHHLEQFQAIAAAKATTMGHIQRSHLRAAMTNCPPHDILVRLDAGISPLIDRLIQNELESCALAMLRDALLPKLVLGTLRTTDCV